jgi:hypothetical protein
MADVHDLRHPIVPGQLPRTPVLWPTESHTVNKIQQTKGSAKPQTDNVPPTTQPNASSVSARTTPATVSNIRVVSKTAKGQKTVTVQFTHPHGDPYFAGANVYLRQGGKQPVQVASGAKSPLSFSVPTTTAPHSIFVTSYGNWGETPVLHSPSARVRLA